MGCEDPFLPLHRSLPGEAGRTGRLLGRGYERSVPAVSTAKLVLLFAWGPTQDIVLHGPLDSAQSRDTPLHRGCGWLAHRDDLRLGRSSSERLAEEASGT